MYKQMKGVADGGRAGVIHCGGGDGGTGRNNYEYLFKFVIAFCLFCINTLMLTNIWQ
jgi:hypothetical protein